MVGSDSPWEGDVEFCFSGRWGTVCDDNWDDTDAETVCRLMGFGNGSLSLATRRAFFRFTRSLVLADEVGCRGNETNFLQCLTMDVGEHDCTIFQHAGVICAGQLKHDKCT